MRFFISLIISIVSMSVIADEYRIGLYQSETLDPQLTTHIIIVGSAMKKDSNQFFQSGVTKAHKYKELYPLHQVVIMSSPDVLKTEDAKVFADFDVTVVKMAKETFTAEKVFKELNVFSKIASIDFFGHSSPWALKIGKSDSALDPSVYKNKLIALKSKLTKDAFMTLSSCNSGFLIAPEFSKWLGIPVAGALTSSLFERIETDGHWYKEADYTAGNYATQNKFSFVDNVSCSNGLCVRLKASRHSYSSSWGTFDGGLSFYKFFCNYEDKENSCTKIMAKSLLFLPSTKALTSSSSKEDYEQVVFDWLCSTSKDKSYFNKCVEGIKRAVARGDNVFQSHPGNELNCDYKSCKASIVCKDKIFGSGPRMGSCRLKTEKNLKPTNAAREYIDLMNGYNYLME